MIITFLLIVSFLRELRKTTRHRYSVRSNSSQGAGENSSASTITTTNTATGTATGGGGVGGIGRGETSCSSVEDFALYSSHTTSSSFCSETIYSSATSATFTKLRNESSSICSDVTIPEDTVQRRCSEEVRMPSTSSSASRRAFGTRSRTRYGSRGSLPRRRRTTGRYPSFLQTHTPNQPHIKQTL